MIRHIVLFKIKEEVTDVDIQKLLRSLKDLANLPMVQELEIGEDFSKKSTSFDIALNSVFKSKKDLENYAIHPEHVSVKDLLNKLCKPPVKVDFEF